MSNLLRLFMIGVILFGFSSCEDKKKSEEKIEISLSTQESAIAKIIAFAQENQNAETPTLLIYQEAGVVGINTSEKLLEINTIISNLTEDEVDTKEKIQALVDRLKIDVIEEIKDTKSPTITLNGDSKVTLTQGVSYKELGAEAVDNKDGNIEVIIEGEVDTSLLKEQTVTYTATDKSGNKSTIKRTIIIVLAPDTTPPIISLNGNSTITLTQGSTYTEEGASATDNRDNRVTVTITGTVDTNSVGTYTISYNAKDSANNKAITLTRTIFVEATVITTPPTTTTDTTPPTITLTGANPQTIEKGTAYTELNASTDDGSAITIDSTSVDTSVVGEYSVTYNATDSSGNKGLEVIRIINIIDSSISEIKDLLDDPTIPYATESDFNKTEYAKEHLDERESEVLQKAHRLVATAIDPDPNWFYTDVDKSVIVTEAGTQHTFISINYQKRVIVQVLLIMRN